MITHKKYKLPRLIIEISLWIVIAILGIGAVFVLEFQIEALCFRYPLDYGEAPLINQAVQINRGSLIYRSDILEPPYTIANYPPIYVMLLALFEKFFGPGFWYGRLISALSMVGSSVVISLIVFSRSHNIKIALIPGLLFFNLPYVVGWSTLARIDHLALFFALMGLLLLSRMTGDEKKVPLLLVFGSLFLVLAIYTRQSYALAAPMAGFCFLLRNKIKHGVLLFAFVGGAVLLLFFLINWITQGGFYFNIVTANINDFGFDRLINHFRNYFDMAALFFLFAAISTLLVVRNVDGWLLPVVFTFGGFLSALTIGKIGSNVNYFLEFSAGLCLLVGFGLIALNENTKKWLSTGGLVLGLILLSWQIINLIQFVQRETRATLDNRIAAIKELITMENLVVKNLHQPILADEFMGMIVLNGGELYLQPFEVTQLIKAGFFDQDQLIQQIEDEKFSLILLQEGEWWSYVLQERWTPELLSAIRANYRLSDQLESSYVYRPRTGLQSTGAVDCSGGFWRLPSRANLGYRYDQGLLTLYSAGAEGQISVTAAADGWVYRSYDLPGGSMIVVYDDPLAPEERVIAYYGDMLAYRGNDQYVSGVYPTGTQGLPISKGDLIGYQGMWSGTINRQDWLHVTFGIAPFNQNYLDDPALLLDNLINPASYFGIDIDPSSDSVERIKCQP